MNNLKVFVSFIFFFAANYSFAYDRVIYSLVDKKLNDGYITMNIQRPEFDLLSNDKSLLMAKDTIVARAKKYNAEAIPKQIWVWGDVVLLSVKYVTEEREFLWRDDIRVTKDNAERTGTALDQLFELSYLSVIKNSTVPDKSPNSPELLEAFIYWEDPDLKPVYKKINDLNQGIEWNVGIVPLNSSLMLDKKGWGLSEGEGNFIVEPLITLLNKFRAENYSYYDDVSSCSKTCKEEINFLKYEYIDKVQKGYQISGRSDLTNAILNWSSVQVLGYIMNGSSGVIYIKPSLRINKGSSGSFEESPIVPFSFSKQGGEYVVVPGIRNDFTNTLLSNKHILSAIHNAAK